jgi:hypothetical protein
MDTTNPRCLQFPARPVALTCVVALKTIKNCAHYLANVSLNRFYIKSQSLLRTKLQIDLPKHVSDLQKTHLKQDLQTIKHHSTLSTNGTLPNYKQIRVGIEKPKHRLYNQMETIETS